ncbi:hypothetical protein HK096_005860, partial [Nowakowskiella sp. JEL0078]
MATKQSPGRTNKESQFECVELSLSSTLRLSRKFPFLDFGGECSLQKLALLAVDNLHGFCVHATSTGFTLCDTTLLLGALLSAPPNSKLPASPSDVWASPAAVHVPLSAPVSHVAIAADHLHIVIALTSGAINVYNVVDLKAEKCDPKAVLYVGSPLGDLKLNTGELVDVGAVLDNNGKLKILRFDGIDLLENNLDVFVTT